MTAKVCVTPLAVLRAARARITAPEAWCQGSNARNATRGPVPAWAKEAVSWCALGAIRVEGAELFSAEAELAISRTAGEPVFRFNDREGTTHADVLDLFDRTIARLEAEAP